MNCKQARRLMQEIADGTPGGHDEFDRHIAQCPGCRLEWHQLQQISAALTETARCEPPAERLERATVRALRMIERQRPRLLAGLSRLGWAAAAVLMIALFASGLYAGRTVWPREVIVTKTVKVPEVREKIVEVEVPVVQEKVVIKRVPVYRTRIVYRDREVPKVTPVAERQREPVKCDEILVYLPSSPIAATAHVSEEVQPAGVIDAGESDETSPTQGHWQPPGSAGDVMVLAQNLPD